VQVHPDTGKRCLTFDGLFSTSIRGLRAGESSMLLAFLRTHLADPSRTCRHRWRAGDFVMWDNRCTAHRSTSDYEGRRVSHRVTVAGELS
jgi:taurine dioxygenase